MSLNLYGYCAGNPVLLSDPSGNVYIIAWSYSGGHTDDYKDENGDVDWDRFTKEDSFARAAYTQKSELVKSGVSESEIIVQRIDNVDDLCLSWDEWAKYDKVDQLYFYSHGREPDGAPEVANGGSHGFWGTEAKLNWSHETRGMFDSSIAAFFGCHTGIGSFAQDFANRQGVRTYGQTGYASFSSSLSALIPIKDKATTGSVYLVDFDVKIPYVKNSVYDPKGIINIDGIGKKFDPEKEVRWNEE